MSTKVDNENKKKRNKYKDVLTSDYLLETENLSMERLRQLYIDLIIAALGTTETVPQ